MEHEEQENKQEKIKDSQYDGIQEYDNDLPKWWLGIFYLSVVFGLIYWIHFYVFRTGDYQKEEMEKDLALHQALHAPAEPGQGEAVTDESIRALMSDSAAMEEAKSTWNIHCIACHGALGEGGVGPNMTDPYWINGGSPTAIHNTIVNGVPEKGMISWKTMLTAQQIQNSSAYILTLQGTNPPNGKAPQGEKE